MTDFRALCVELLDELKYQTDWSIAEELKERASAALAEPKPEGPTDEELLAALKEAIIAFPPNHPDAKGLPCVEYETQLELRKARAIFATWGSPAPRQIPVTERLPGPLVDSEVAELVEWLNDHAYVLNEHGARIVRRTVDLLKQLPPRPISVTERLPGNDTPPVAD